jgi:hypothetical protein
MNHALMVISDDLDIFYGDCVSSPRCLRCDDSLKQKRWACLAQVYRVEKKGTHRLTGGALCEECGGQFKDWLTSSPHKKNRKTKRKA